jgi:biopolymer transport protein ExbD
MLMNSRRFKFRNCPKRAGDERDYSGRSQGSQVRALIIATAIVILLASYCNAQLGPLRLTVLPNCHMRFNDGPELDARGLRAKIRELMREKPRPDIRIIPDRMAHYDAVARVLGTFQQLGYGPHFGFTGISN